MIDPSRLARVRRARIDAQRRRRDERVWPANFSDRLTSPLPGRSDLIKIMRTGGFRGPKADADLIPVTRSGFRRAGANEVVATWVGHATFVVQIGGLTVLTDPVWSSGIPGVPRRLTPPGVTWGELPQVDAVVISHNHYDHLDAPTIRRLPRDTPILVPAALARWFTRRGFVDVTELDWWESTSVGGVQFDFVPAHHWSRRMLTDTCRSLWGGWIMSADSVGNAESAGAGARVYFAGDTGYGHWFGEIGARYPGIDLALVPIGAYDPEWFMQPAHLNPEEAVQACADVGAPRMASMHWGTFTLSREPCLEPLERVRKAWAAAERPTEDLWDLAVGESRTLPTHPK